MAATHAAASLAAKQLRFFAAALVLLSTTAAAVGVCGGTGAPADLVCKLRDALSFRRFEQSTRLFAKDELLAANLVCGSIFCCCLLKMHR